MVKKTKHVEPLKDNAAVSERGDTNLQPMTQRTNVPSEGAATPDNRLRDADAEGARSEEPMDEWDGEYEMRAGVR